MTRSRLILVFAVAFAVLIITPAFLSQSFSPYPLMKTGDVTDLITPMIMIPLYWLLFRNGKPPSTREIIAFLVFTAFWVEGQGMHLGANSIGHLIGEFQGSDAQQLTHFYDEVLGHYLWHIGIVTLAALLIWRQMQNRSVLDGESMVPIWIAAALYGFTYFVAFDEAGTVPLGLPFAAGIVIVGLWQRRHLREQPITTFFVAAHGLALVLFAIWFVINGGFPQFSELGMI